MKKRYVLGGVVTGVTFCAVMAFNSFIFPHVLAATPAKSTVSTVTAASIAAPSATAASSVNQQTADEVLKAKADAAEKNSNPDVNAISKDKAIEIATNMAQKAFGSGNLVGTAFYSYNSAPNNPSYWSVYVTKNALTSDLQQAYLVQLNAYTGKSIGQTALNSCYVKAYPSQGPDGIFVTNSLSLDH